MSELAKSFAKTKVASFPTLAPELPLYEDEEQQQQQLQQPIDDDSSSASSLSSTGTVRPTSSQKPASASQWSDYFAQELYLDHQSESGSAKYHVYLTPPASLAGPLIVAHHGAGSSAMSFALFAP